MQNFLDFTTFLDLHKVGLTVTIIKPCSFLSQTVLQFVMLDLFLGFLACGSSSLDSVASVGAGTGSVSLTTVSPAVSARSTQKTLHKH